MVGPGYVPFDSVRNMVRYPKDEGDKPRNWSAATPPPTADIVQFAAPIRYVREEEKFLALQAIRIGHCRDACSVEYKTRDGSAKAGRKYEAAQGMLKFAAGEFSQSFTVQIVDDDAFDTTVEFTVHLTKPRNCTTQIIGDQCRVLILDDDTFPANEFKDDATSEEHLHARGFAVLLAFMAFTWGHVPDIKQKTIVSLLLAQLGNMYYLAMIYLQAYLVDTATNLNPSTSSNLWIKWGKTDEDNHKLTIAFLALCIVAPNFILTGVEWFEVRVLEMGFTIKTNLRVSLFRKYLTYTEESRRQVPIQDLKTTMMDDIPEVVGNGYIIIIKLWRVLGKIVMVTVFLLRKHPESALPMLFYASLTVTVLYCCHNRRMKLLTQQGEDESQLIGHLFHASSNQKLIADYHQQSHVVREWEDGIARKRASDMEIKMFIFKIELLIPWITHLVTGFYMAYGGCQVVDGALNTGTYLATIRIYGDLGGRFENLFGCFSNMTECIEPLVGLTVLLNLPTALGTQKSVQESRQKCSDELVRSMRTDGSVSVFDQLQIGFRHLSVPHAPSLSKKPLTLQTPQGNVICVLGSDALGKATLLNILADKYSAAAGTVELPGHLSVLNVSHQPLLIESYNLLGNLIYGSEGTTDIARVRGILRRLKLDRPWILEEFDKGMKQEIKLKVQESEGEDSSEDEASESEKDEKEEEDEDSHEWQGKLSTSQRKRLHLARAFIYNPEVMLMHRPLEGLDDDLASCVLSLMREFVDSRGVEMDTSDFASRRPRTLFFTSGSTARTNISDLVWRTSEHGIVAERGQR